VQEPPLASLAVCVAASRPQQLSDCFHCFENINLPFQGGFFLAWLTVINRKTVVDLKIKQSDTILASCTIESDSDQELLKTGSL
jgi:hypothetical protein